jgi:hypothetical protein
MSYFVGMRIIFALRALGLVAVGLVLGFIAVRKLRGGK